MCVVVHLEDADKVDVEVRHILRPVGSRSTAEQHSYGT